MFWKNVPKKSYQQLDGNMPFFSLLLMFVKLVLLITFFRGIFLRLFQRIRNQREILRYLISFFIFFKKIIFWVILALFKNFEAKRAKNGSKSQKTYFVNVSSISILHPSKGLYSSFSKKSQIRCTLLSMSSIKLLHWKHLLKRNTGLILRKNVEILSYCFTNGKVTVYGTSGQNVKVLSYIISYFIFWWICQAHRPESQEPKRPFKHCYTVSCIHFFKGIVSGGRGEIGHCGGINNPVHYTRYCTLFFLLILKKNKVNYELFRLNLDPYLDPLSGSISGSISRFDESGFENLNRFHIL